MRDDWLMAKPTAEHERDLMEAIDDPPSPWRHATGHAGSGGTVA